MFLNDEITKKLPKYRQHQTALTAILCEKSIQCEDIQYSKFGLKITKKILKLANILSKFWLEND